MIDKIIAPYPIAAASLAFFKAMTVQSASTVAKYFGISSGDINTSNPDPEIEKTIKKLQAKQTAGGNTASGSPNQASSSTTASTTSAAPESGATQTPGTPSPKATARAQTPDYRRTAASSDAADRPLAKNIPYYPITEGSGAAWSAFKETYRRKWRPLRVLPPRGSLAIHGIVALESPKGRLYIDVFAWYHPKTRTFHNDSMTMNLRGITPFNQRPRR